jgi:hypothetical protein
MSLGPWQLPVQASARNQWLRRRSLCQPLQSGTGNQKMQKSHLRLHLKVSRSSLREGPTGRRLWCRSSPGCVYVTVTLQKSTGFIARMFVPGRVESVEKLCTSVAVTPIRSAPLISGKEKVEEMQVEAAALPWPINEVVIAKEGKIQENVLCMMVSMFDGVDVRW